MATKPRSPNYPAISLPKAVEQARKVYAANHLHKASPEVVAKAIGYSSLNGGSLTAISALKKYGLIEDDNKELRIYTTTIPTTHRLCTLMHDPQYRLSVAWQNVGYNQPPHPGFYLGDGMAPPPRPNIATQRAQSKAGQP